MHFVSEIIDKIHLIAFKYNVIAFVQELFVSQYVFVLFWTEMSSDKKTLIYEIKGSSRKQKWTRHKTLRYVFLTHHGSDNWVWCILKKYVFLIHKKNSQIKMEGLIVYLTIWNSREQH